MLIIAAIGCLCAVFIATLFLKNSRPSPLANRLMGILFLLIAIRLGKVLVQSSELEVLKAVYFNLMHSAFLALGPVMLFYTKSYEQRSKWSPLWLLHFAPALFVLLTASWLRGQVVMETWLRLYEFILFFPLPYLFLVGFQTIKSAAVPKFSLPLKVLSLVTVIWLMNALYYWFEFPFYWVTGILVTCLFYFLLLAVKPGRLLTPKKYDNLKVDTEQYQRLFLQLDKSMREEKLYMDANLRLEVLSKHLGVSLHLLSGAINSVTGMGFPQYLHESRIAAAQKMLREQPKMKIAAVAYEVGYQSLSTFNTAFKNKTNLTPSQYKSKISGKKGS